MTPYQAPWWLPGGHLQTLYGALGPAPRVAWRRERWDTPDGDFIELDWAGGAHGPLLALFHGLEGGSSSHYARKVAAQAQARGWRCVVPHFRGCSGAMNRLPRAYHSGDSAELDWILRRLRPDFAAGVSLGGNALLKWLGEQGADAAALVRRAVAVSAPVDLAASGHALGGGLNRALYARHFLVTLKAKAAAKIRLHRLPLDAARVQCARTLHEFDDQVTAPLHGFRDADDYWARASSGPFLERIRVPTLLLNALNDPFLPRAPLAAATRRASRDVMLEFPETGGHAGFPGRGHWLARRILDFCAAP
ncbi:MAG: alpha/beta fold hydrolase [Betaproteobacteria bacterium]|nr:alpha/beta fold hydrolase [Betaproteobacteria bacterium]MDH4325858.1 alpha/beta fold hydrolase [Betaproteobacteria bacterium]MDH5579431.1 alpha/beta fold hydrolase [Betaproteobacteria bacterium]